MNLNISHLKLSSQKEKRNEKVQREPKKLIGHHQCTNIFIMGFSEEKTEKWTGSLFTAIMAETFINLGKEVDTEI